jgi:hypothetical protein
MKSRGREILKMGFVTAMPGIPLSFDCALTHWGLVWRSLPKYRILRAKSISVVAVPPKGAFTTAVC